MIRVLFVCLGNICRSPLAEGLFRYMVVQEGYGHLFTIDSAATSNFKLGQSLDERALRITESISLPKDHKAKLLSMDQVINADFVLVMDNDNLSHLKKIIAYSPEEINKIHLMKKFDPESEGEILDPSEGSNTDFEHVYQDILRCSKGFLQFLKNEGKLN